MKLIDIYNEYKEEFENKKVRPHPAKLLTLLMLSDKEKYHISKFNFYLDNKIQIDRKIDKVIEDFNISKEEIIDMLSAGNDEASDIIRNDYTLYKNLKYVVLFYSGYKIVEWGNRYFKDSTPEEIYYMFLDKHNEKGFESTKINKLQALKRIKENLKHIGKGVK